ncbi:MAG: DUF3592 domain-containing protein, partial [Pseudomonadota bacterium]
MRYLVPLLMLLIGILLLSSGYGHWQKSSQLLKSSTSVEGTIISIDPFMSSKAGKSSSLHYFPRVAFTTASGEQLEFQSRVTHRADHYKPGDKVRVLYRQDAPENAVIGSFNALWALAALFSASGVLVMA